MIYLFSANEYLKAVVDSYGDMKYQAVSRQLRTSLSRANRLRDWASLMVVKYQLVFGYEQQHLAVGYGFLALRAGFLYHEMTN